MRGRVSSRLYFKFIEAHRGQVKAGFMGNSNKTVEPTEHKLGDKPGEGGEVTMPGWRLAAGNFFRM